MKIHAYTFTNREMYLIQKALFTYMCEYERAHEENGEERERDIDDASERFYKKEYEDMKALYITL